MFLYFFLFSLALTVIIDNTLYRYCYGNFSDLIPINLRVLTTAAHRVEVYLINDVSSFNVNVYAGVYEQITGLELDIEPRTAVSKV